MRALHALNANQDIPEFFKIKAKEGYIDAALAAAKTISVTAKKLLCIDNFKEQPSPSKELILKAYEAVKANPSKVGNALGEVASKTVTGILKKVRVNYTEDPKTLFCRLRQAAYLYGLASALKDMSRALKESGLEDDMKLTAGVVLLQIQEVLKAGRKGFCSEARDYLANV